MVKYVQNDGSLEKELDLNPASGVIPAVFKEVLENTILPNVADTTQYYVSVTLCTAISKNEKQRAGHLCIIGEPNANGEIETGYGTYDKLQGRGYMTEMVGGIIEWDKTQPAVRTVIASAGKTNTPSSRALKKKNFVKVSETGAIFKWKLDFSTAANS